MIARRQVTWQRLAPWPDGWCDSLRSIAALLDSEDTAAKCDASESASAYPEPVLADLRAHGLAAHFDGADAATDAVVTAPHLTLLNVLTARASGSLAITVGVHALALLPLLVAGSIAQRRAFAVAVAEGKGAALLLTELPHGSNLLANEASATLRADGGFTLHGDKDMINGGERHAYLVVLLRTAPASSASGLADFTLFAVARDPSVQALPPWRTLPCPAADIAGVRFAGTVVGPDAVVGEVGDGFGIVQRTLGVSRGGISGLAAGASDRARELASEYARERRPYGAPIAAFEAVGRHLARLDALDLAVQAISVKQAAIVNAFGLTAGGITAAAKYAACTLAEEAVDEGRRVLGARALLERYPYARLVRDVVLYSVFDGTTHVMLEQLALRAAQLAATPAGVNDALAWLRDAYGTPVRPLGQVLARARRIPVAPIDAQLEALGTLTRDPAVAPSGLVASELLDGVREARADGRWEAHQTMRHEAAAALALLEALSAIVELTDDDVRRALIGRDHGLPLGVERCSFAVRWFGARVARSVRSFSLCWGFDAARSSSVEAMLAREVVVTERALAQTIASGADVVERRP